MRGYAKLIRALNWWLSSSLSLFLFFSLTLVSLVLEDHFNPSHAVCDYGFLSFPSSFSDEEDWGWRWRWGGVAEKWKRDAVVEKGRLIPCNSAGWVFSFSLFACVCGWDQVCLGLHVTNDVGICELAVVVQFLKYGTGTGARQWDGIDY